MTASAASSIVPVDPAVVAADTAAVAAGEDIDNVPELVTPGGIFSNAHQTEYSVDELMSSESKCNIISVSMYGWSCHFMN